MCFVKHYLLCALHGHVYKEAADGMDDQAQQADDLAGVAAC